MGRTVTPFSEEYAAFQQRALKFRRALRQEDQLILDEILEGGRLHTPSGVYAAAPLPLESVLLSVLIEHKKTINHLQAALNDLRQHLQLPTLTRPPARFSNDQQPPIPFPASERGDDADPKD